MLLVTLREDQHPLVLYHINILRNYYYYKYFLFASFSFKNIHNCGEVNADRGELYQQQSLKTLGA